MAQEVRVCCFCKQNFDAHSPLFWCNRCHIKLMKAMAWVETFENTDFNDYLIETPKEVLYDTEEN